MWLTAGKDMKQIIYNNYLLHNTARLFGSNLSRERFINQQVIHDYNIFRHLGTDCSGTINKGNQTILPS